MERDDLTVEDSVEILARAQADGVESMTLGEERRCRLCGCTDTHACFDVSGCAVDPDRERCHWVADNLCSFCATDDEVTDE